MTITNQNLRNNNNEIKEIKVTKHSLTDFFKSGKLFLQPTKKVLSDLYRFFFINTLLVYITLFFIPDTTVAMVSAIFVGIIAWRGGILAGLIASGILFVSNALGTQSPPHKLPDQSFFNNQVPGYMIGLAQCLLTGLIAGYIAKLVHKLREEINLRKLTQLALEQKVTELDIFSRTVAHDLKNPLSIISMSTQLLSKEFAKTENEKVIRSITIINDTTKNMKNIIESILLLAGIKKIDPRQYVLFPMSECIDEAIKRMEHILVVSNVQINKPDNWPSVFGYAPWLTEAWVNYISNAIKYGSNPKVHDRIVIDLGFDPPGTNLPAPTGHIRFWVKDYGQGIEDRLKPNLFKDFSRLHSSECEGHGLGLSIVKSLIDKFEGTVGVESKVGEGSLFYFTTPSPVLDTIPAS